MVGTLGVRMAGYWGDWKVERKVEWWVDTMVCR